MTETQCLQHWRGAWPQKWLLTSDLTSVYHNQMLSSAFLWSLAKLCYIGLEPCFPSLPYLCVFPPRSYFSFTSYQSGMVKAKTCFHKDTWSYPTATFQNAAIVDVPDREANTPSLPSRKHGQFCSIGASHELLWQFWNSELWSCKLTIEQTLFSVVPLGRPCLICCLTISRNHLSLRFRFMICAITMLGHCLLKNLNFGFCFNKVCTWTLSLLLSLVCWKK